MGVAIKVKKGKEILEIPDSDLKAAVNDGYLPIQKVVVANSKTQEVYEIDPQDLPNAFKDGFEYSPTSKKKGQTGGIGSLVGGQVGSSAGLSEKERLSNYLYNLKTPEQKEQSKLKPLTQIKKPVKNERPFDQTREQAIEGAYKKVDEIMYGDGNEWKDPIASLQSKYKEDPANVIGAIELTKMSLMPNGSTAVRVLNDSHFKDSDWGNVTGNLLKQRANSYTKATQPLREMSFYYGNQITDNPEDDYNYKDKIYTAAVKMLSEKDPVFRGQLKASGIDINDPNVSISNKLESSVRGKLMYSALNDSDFIDYIQNENPKLFNAVSNISKDLLTDNIDFGINVVANEISKARQREGFNNPIVEFDDNNFRKETDLVAQSLYRDDPVKMKIYQDFIQEDPDKYIDTPSLFEGAAHGAKGIYKGVGNTFTEPFRGVPESIKRSWEKEASYVSADPKGITKFMYDTGHVLGLVGAIGGISNVLGGGGVGVYSKNIVPAISGGVLPFLGDSLEEGRKKYSTNPVKAWTSALFNTAAYAALSQHIFPADKLQKAIGIVKPELNNITQRLTSGAITREVARQEANTAFKKALDFGVGTVKGSAKISAELAAITAFNKGLDKIMMDKDEFEQFHYDGETIDTFNSMFLSNLVLSGVTKYGQQKRSNRIAKESYYELASNPKRYERVINNSVLENSFGTINEMKENLSYISKLKEQLDREGVPAEAQKEFIFQSLREKTAKELSEKTQDSTLKKQQLDIISDAEKIKQEIIDGKYEEPEPFVDVNKLADQERKLNTEGGVTPEGAIQNAIEAGEIKGYNLDAAQTALSEGKVEQFMKEVAEQAQDETGNLGIDNYGVAIDNYGVDVVDLAVKMFPKQKEQVGSVVDEGVKKSIVKRTAKSLGVNDDVASKIHDIALKAKDYEDFKKQVGELGLDDTVAKNIHAEQYDDIRQEAKSEYEQQLEKNLEDLREAYSDATRSDAGLRSMTEKSPTSIRNFIKRLLGGTTPEDVAKNKARLVEMQRQYRKEKAEMRSMLPRERGTNFVIEKLSRAARNGEISQEAADLAIDLLRKQPDMFQDLAISITGKKGENDGVQGWYRAADALVKIFKNPSDPTTAVHEILHHTERFLPHEIRDKIIGEWNKEVEAQIKHYQKLLKETTNTDERQQITQGLLFLGMAQERQLEPNAANREAMERIMSKYLGDHTDSKGNFHKGLGNSWYQLYNPSEWFAVNASRLFREAKNKPELKTWTDKAKAFYDYLITAVKRIFKGSPTEAVEKALKAILNGETLQDREGKMLSASQKLLNIKQKGSFEDRLKSIYDEVRNKQTKKSEQVGSVVDEKFDRDENNNSKVNMLSVREWAQDEFANKPQSQSGSSLYIDGDVRISDHNPGSKYDEGQLQIGSYSAADINPINYSKKELKEIIEYYIERKYSDDITEKELWPNEVRDLIVSEIKEKFQKPLTNEPSPQDTKQTTKAEEVKRSDPFELDLEKSLGEEYVSKINDKVEISVYDKSGEPIQRTMRAETAIKKAKSLQKALKELVNCI